MDAPALLNALLTKNWYALAAVTLMILIQIARKNELKFWGWIPSGFRFLWPVIGAAGAAFVHGFLTKEPLHQALLDTLNSVWQIAIPAMGGAAALKESPIPWDGGKGGALQAPAADAPPA